MWKYPKQIIVLVVGATIILFGVALLFLPGPGIAIIIAGLAVLATEFVWAKRLLRRMKEEATNVGSQVVKFGQSKISSGNSGNPEGEAQKATPSEDASDCNEHDRQAAR